MVSQHRTWRATTNHGCHGVCAGLTLSLPWGSNSVRPAQTSCKNPLRKKVNILDITMMKSALSFSGVPDYKCNNHKIRVDNIILKSWLGPISLRPRHFAVGGLGVAGWSLSESGCRDSVQAVSFSQHAGCLQARTWLSGRLPEESEQLVTLTLRRWHLFRHRASGAESFRRIARGADYHVISVETLHWDIDRWLTIATTCLQPTNKA